MAENIINSEGLTEKALESAEDFASPEQADPEAAKRFGSLLNGENAESPVLQDTIAPVGDSSGEALTLGDKILQGMQGLREHMDGGAEQVKRYLGKDEALSMREMFQTQMAMTNLMVTEDYVGKIVSKSTQTFDTLLRNQ